MFVLQHFINEFIKQQAAAPSQPVTYTEDYITTTTTVILLLYYNYYTTITVLYTEGIKTNRYSDFCL